MGAHALAGQCESLAFAPGFEARYETHNQAKRGNRELVWHASDKSAISLFLFSVISEWLFSPSLTGFGW
jgi:hypothetical protein